MSLPYRFLLSAILFAVIGMALGLHMGPSQDFTLVPVHVHLNLIGWASMAIFGLYYRGDSIAAASKLAGWQFWIAFVGMVLFAVGLAALQYGNYSFEIVLIVGAVMTLISMLIFGVVVWQAARRR